MAARVLLLAAASAVASAKFSFVMPWFCLERCGDSSSDIANEYWQLAVNTSTFTGVAFEDYNLGQNSLLIKNNLTQIAAPVKALGLQRWAMVSSYPYPPQFLNWMRQVFQNPTPFISACLKAAAVESLTGFNIDWEPQSGDNPTAQDAADYAAFLTTFSDAMHSHGILTSVDVATWSDIWNYTLLGQSSVDYIMTMSTYTGSDKLFPQEVQTAAASIPLSKLVIGLETTNDDNNGAPFNKTQLDMRFSTIAAAGIDKIAIWKAPIPDLWWSYMQA